MNAASVAVLAVILVLCGLAFRRVFRKGVPCECGGNRPCCGSCAGCRAPACPSGAQKKER